MRQITKSTLLFYLTVYIMVATLPYTYANSCMQEDFKPIELTEEYSYVGPFINGVAVVKRNGGYGYISKSGLEVVAPKYRYAESFSNGLGLVRTYSGYGYIGKEGDEIIPTTYPIAYSFSNVLAKIKTGHITSFIDRTGKKVFSFTGGFADDFSEGMTRFLNDSSASSDGFVTNTGKWGFLDKSGKLVIPAIYGNVNSFSEGLAGVYKSVDGRKLSGFIDKTEKIIIPIKYYLVSDFSEGLAWVEKIDGSRFFIDKTGKEIIPLNNYDEVKDFSEGLALVAKDIDNNYSTGYYGIDKYGFIDKTGKLLIPLTYDTAESFSEGLALVKKDGKYGYINKTGKVVIPLIYDEAQVFSEGIAWVKKGNKQMLIHNPILVELASKKNATQTKSQVFVNGKKINFDAYLIEDNNYFKLRDIGKVLSGTNSQFDIIWDKDKNTIHMISGIPYTQVGGELLEGDGISRIGIVSTSKISLNNQEICLKGYNINGNNYFKLRDIAKAFDIGVTWNSETKTIGIDTTIEYTQN